MKISFIIPWITQSRGGTENVGHLIANAMVDKGHDVHIYTFDAQKRPATWPLKSAIKLHYMPQGDSSRVDRQMAVALAEACPDLIVGLHMNRTMLRYTVAALKINVPLVLSEHIDPHFPNRLGVFSDDERLAAFTGATRVHLLNTAFVETVPEHLRCKINVIPNTVVSADQASDPVGGARKTLITVARLVARKNLGRLIDEFSLIASKHKDWTLQILGDGPVLKKLKERAIDKGVGGQVEFLGHSETPYSHIKKAQMFVLPSLFEGFPMSSLEAMTHGMPLVGYAACNGINEQILDGVNGRLAPRSLEHGSLAGCLDELMGDKELRIKMGAASKKRFDELYSNQVVFDAWEEMFQQAVAGSPSMIPSDFDARANSILQELVKS